MAAASRRVSSAEIVGRRHELAVIERAIEEISDGRPRVIVIGGDAGVGKTRLIEEAAADAGEDVRFLRGNCLSFGAGIPYLPFAEMMRELIRQVPIADIVRIAGPARGELARFVPEVAQAIGTKQVSSVGSSDLERLRLFEALLRVAESIAQDRPSVFVIEDIQWIDRSSLELFSFLTHNIRTGQVLLIVTVRDEALDAAAPIVDLLADLERGRDVDRLELKPLDSEATQRLIAGILGERLSRATADRIWRLGDGNPLFIEELVAARDDLEMDAAVPPRLRDLMGARSGRLPKDVQSVLRIAATAGRSVDAKMLVQTSGFDRERIDGAIELALEEHILERTTGDSRGIRFRHEIMRTAIASQVADADAEQIHATYAQALLALPAERRSPSEIAYHWDAAGATAEALTAHVEAGLAAEAGFAYEQASDHFERALALWPGVDGADGLAGYPHTRIMQRASSAAARAGDHARAIELAQRILAEEPDADPDWLELVRSSLRWYLWESGRHEEALDAARAAVANQTDETSMRWRANAMAHLAGLLLVSGGVGEAAERAEAALRIAKKADVAQEQTLAAGIIGWCRFLDGDTDDGLERLRGAVDEAGAIEDSTRGLEAQHFDERGYPVGQVLAYRQLTTALELAGRFDDAAVAAAEGVAVATAQGVERTYGSSLHAAGARALYRAGRWDEASTVIDSAIRGGASGVGRIELLGARARLEVGRGLGSQADATMDEAEAEIDDPTARRAARWVAVARAEWLAWEGRPLEAVGVLASVADEADPTAAPAAPGQVAGIDAAVPALLVLGARAAADLALLERAGDTEAMASSMAAERIRAAIRRIKRRPGLADSWASDVALAAAELARAEHGLGTRTSRQWQAAVDANEGLPYAQAYARWRLAAALFSDRRRRDQGAEQLGLARSSAEPLQAGALLRATDELARRAGLRAEPSGEMSDAPKRGERPFGLTEREAEVLALLAAGQSNNEIADRLFISPKTASVHVSNIYGKLGVESRVAAATMAHDLGLATPIEEVGVD